jgi:hypothetical protein
VVMAVLVELVVVRRVWVVFLRLVSQRAANERWRELRLAEEHIRQNLPAILSRVVPAATNQITKRIIPWPTPFFKFWSVAIR